MGTTPPAGPSARSSGSRPSISSRQEPTSVATTGTPLAKLSSTTSGSASLIEVSTRQAHLGEDLVGLLEAEELHLVPPGPGCAPARGTRGRTPGSSSSGPTIQPSASGSAATTDAHGPDEAADVLDGHHPADEADAPAAPARPVCRGVGGEAAAGRCRWGSPGCAPAGAPSPIWRARLPSYSDDDGVGAGVGQPADAPRRSAPTAGARRCDPPPGR